MKARKFAHRLVTRLIFPALGLALPLTALASDVGGTKANRDTRLDAHWQQLDANRDGMVSRAEYTRFHNERRAAGTAASNDSARGLERALAASRFIGTAVRSRQGDALGEIQDLLVDIPSGRIEGAILSYGGIGDIGDKLFHYPLASFARGASGELVLDVDTQKLEDATGFDRDNWPFANAQRSGAKVALWRASRLLGKDVEDRNGEHLGEISDLVIDAGKAQVAHALLRYDRPWSLDNPLVALPLGSFRFDGPREDVSMDVEKERIDAQRLSEMGQSSPEVDTVVVERWFILTPRQEVTAAADDASGTQPASQTDAPASESRSRADKNVGGVDGAGLDTNAAPSK